ncbi:MAG: cupin domain-containing protein [Ramlibacter sp.]
MRSDPDTVSSTPLSERAAALRATLVRNVNEVPLERLLREPHYDVQGTRLAKGTAAKKLGASFDILAPGKRGCPYHLHHAQEEMFIILEGAGTLRVAGEMLPLRAGDVIFIPPGPEYPHQILNTSDAPLKYLSISTKEVPEICEYPDSGKYLAEGSLDTATPFEVIERRTPSVDYWDGEP